MFITSVKVPKGAPVKKPSSVHRVFAIDCSYSMCGDLRLVREQLKNKIPLLTNPGDTVSLIWFSGSDEFGLLYQGTIKSDPSSFINFNKAIDKWLVPVGLTGFKQPIELAANLARDHKKENPNTSAQLFFMTDGYDNQWSAKDILAAVKNSADHIDSVTFVEYGWYCNRPLMTKMAEEVGAALIFSENFTDYDAEFESNLTKSVVSVKKVEVAVPGSALPYVFTMEENEIVCQVVQNGSVLVPEGTKKVYLFSKEPCPAEDDCVYYAGLYTLAQRMLTEEVFAVLGKLGDKYFIDKFSNCFSKQDYSDFQASLVAAVLSKKERFKEGKDLKYLPAEDAFTVTDFLDVVASDPGNRFFPYDAFFSYEKISAGRTKALTVEESDREKELLRLQGELDEAWEEKKKARLITDEKERLKALDEASAKVLDISVKMDYIIGMGSVQDVSFEPKDPEMGYPIGSLTFNETRPNISVQVMIPGTVQLPVSDFTEVRETEGYGKNATVVKDSVLPRVFETHIYRNYAVVKDGIKHSSLKCLPLGLTDNTVKALLEAGVELPKSRKIAIAAHWYFDGVDSEGRPRKAVKFDYVNMYYFDAKNMPVINRAMSKKVSAKDFFYKVVELQNLKSSQKVVNKFVKDFSTFKGQAWKDLYGEDAVEWLKGLGITEGGYSPRTVQAETKDVYMAKEFKVSIAKCSSIPTINDTLINKVKTASKAPTLSESLCVPMLKKCMDFMESDVYLNSVDQKSIANAWLMAESDYIKSRTRYLIKEIAKTKFTIMVGHTWFEEFDSLDQNTMDVEFNGQVFSCKAELRDIEVKI